MEIPPSHSPSCQEVAVNAEPIPPSVEKNAVRYKYGVCVPCNIKEALKFDEENGNTM